MDRTTIETEQRHTSGVYTKRPIALVSGFRARVRDADGREYIDCIAGHGVANVGHAHPAVVRAIGEQAARLASCPNGYCNDRRAELLARLSEIAPAGLDRIFLCNSGAEAVEAALKFARLATGRAGIVAAMRGFHGRTFGAMSATWSKAYREPFAPLVPGVTFVPYNRVPAMADAIGAGTGAVILEVIQGEGGVHPAEDGYLQEVAVLCRRRGALLILDEVQTGFARTGRMFACTHHGVVPDIMCVAKAIAGGIPMGAVLLGPRVGVLPKRAHGSTFGGNPLACAAACACIDVIEQEGLAPRAADLGARLLHGLRAIDSPRIRTVRGVGLMVAVELKEPGAPHLAALAERGVLALPAGSTVIRFLPPLVISPQEVDAVIDRVGTTLRASDKRP